MKADWSRAEIKFLKSFGQRIPFEMDPGTENQTYTVDFRLVNDKIMVRAKVNGGSFQDFVVDTGAESTIVTRPTAQRLGIHAITYTLSAGVGNAGLRGLQLARIDSLELGALKMRNIPALIKDPPMRDLRQLGRHGGALLRRDIVDPVALEHARLLLSRIGTIGGVPFVNRKFRAKRVLPAARGG